MHLKGAGPKAQKPKEIEKPKAPVPRRLSRDETLALRKTVRSYEDRVTKLSTIRDKIVTTLADPEFYDKATSNQAESIQKKYAEVIEALEYAETQWMGHLEKLETTGSA